MDKLKNLIETASGRKKANLVFKNAQVVNVFTQQLLQGDVAVENGLIAGVGNYQGETEIDCTGLTLCPGFVDAHLHIESTMVLPRELVGMVLPSGTTTLVADPHEIVNVGGAQAMQFMLDASENLPCNIYFMLPSSVPATPFETAGGDFTAQDMAPFLQHPRVLGLGEAMCYPDVVQGQGAIMDKLRLCAGKPIDGHAPGLTGKELQTYKAAGVCTEHECTTFAEAVEKAQAGFAILVREGSAAHNTTTLVQGLVETGLPTSRFMFCTDDKHIDDIWRDGHIRWNIKLAIDLGMSPVQAITMASWNAAQCYGLQGIGAIAPGYKADIVLLRDMKKMEIAAVYKDGVEAGQRLQEMPVDEIHQQDLLHSVKIKTVTPQDFAMPARPIEDVIEMVPFQLETRHLREAVPSENGFFKPGGEYCKLCVVERHGKNGNIAVAPLKGYGITGGAIATTVAHDSHNILAAGDKDEDIALAVNRLGEIGGGYVLVQNGKLVGEVALSVAGLMSVAPAQQVQKACHALLEKATAMGIPYHVDPFTSLSFLALPVIPAIRLTDKGLFDVETFTMIER